MFIAITKPMANDGNWHICDAQLMAPMSDQRSLELYGFNALLNGNNGWLKSQSDGQLLFFLLEQLIVFI
jgi:hypothetical protein